MEFYILPVLNFDVTYILPSINGFYEQVKQNRTNTRWVRKTSFFLSIKVPKDTCLTWYKFVSVYHRINNTTGLRLYILRQVVVNLPSPGRDYCPPFCYL